MSDKLQNALDHLNEILPLRARQEQCPPPVKTLHQQILSSFVTHGRVLTKAEMAEIVADVPAALAQLHQYDMITISATGDLIGAYPFTTSSRGHAVQVNGHWLYAMCAVDALAIAPMFQTRTHISSRCSITAAPIEISMVGETVQYEDMVQLEDMVQNKDTVQNKDMVQPEDTAQNKDTVGDIHVGIGWAAANGSSCCADSLCTEMIFLRDQRVAEQWLSDHTEGREIFTLAEAIQFASRFFALLLS
ncbi:MAG: hypothetical protein KDE54_18360 [Caldilineaceae bacterium]|nr:hypothetical protein [Caldilineaceae bacterium]MCB0143782.1 hypothetical protein [Caldilineaceae bacterium]